VPGTRGTYILDGHVVLHVAIIEDSFALIGRIVPRTIVELLDIRSGMP
jgi:hypothetical protein